MGPQRAVVCRYLQRSLQEDWLSSATPGVFNKQQPTVPYQSRFEIPTSRQLALPAYATASAARART